MTVKQRMTVKKRYPFGKAKAFNVTYDDGVLQDVRFVTLLDQYRIKGTFNLNSQLAKEEFEWTHESGRVIKRLSTDKLVPLYAEHEIASHTLTHPYMDRLTEDEIMHELRTDKKNLETTFHRKIKGFAVPFDYYSDKIEKCVKECGFAYARISEESRSFTPQTDYFRWKPTVFHTDASLPELTKRFIGSDKELALFQIAGHSYDLDTENMWERMERIFASISVCEDALPMTTIGIIDYLKAMRGAEITNRIIHNNSDIDLWFSVGEDIVKVKPGEIVYY